MSTTIASCAAAPPPLTGGGAPAQSPIQAPVTAGGATGAPQSPMQVPMQGSAVQGAAGGGALAQPTTAPTTTAPATAAMTEPAPQATATQGAATVSGGGASVDMAQVLPALQQVVTTLTALVTQLQGQAGGAQAQAGSAGVQGGGDSSVAGDTGAGSAPVEGGGGPVQQVPPGGGSGCGCAKAAGESVANAAPDQRAEKSGKKARKRDEQLPEAPPLPGAAGDGKLNSDALTVKGTKMTAEQRRLTETVLRVGKQMGANQKVLETAVATMIQESTIRNDSSVDSKDHDSLGLFQQRPSAGWGTRAQISDPEYAAKKFFEKAIPNDRKKPDQPKTLLAQSVQISAYPNAYAQWDKEAEKIVADYLG